MEIRVVPFLQLIENSGFESPQQIDEGGCGYSFKAYDPKLGRDVFIKYYETSIDFNERILSEPRKIAALFSDDGNAPDYIASIYSANEKAYEDMRYIEMVTEFCSGESLYKLLHRESLYVYDAIEFAKQIVEGVHVLHSKRIVHRDIKPSNLVISSGKIKIIDLGGASELAIGQPHLTSASKHSIFYRPPEAFSPTNIYGTFSDIYQIGLVLYEMINGPITEDASQYKVAAVIKSEERRIGTKYEDMRSFEQSDALDLCIKHLAEKGKLLGQARKPKRLYDKQLATIVNAFIHPDYNKRADSCSKARMKLSSYSGANWRDNGDNSVDVKNFKGRDYKFREFENSRSILVFETLSTKCGEDKWQKNNRITNWNDVENFLNH